MQVDLEKSVALLDRLVAGQQLTRAEHTQANLAIQAIREALAELARLRAAKQPQETNDG